MSLVSCPSWGYILPINTNRKIDYDSCKLSRSTPSPYNSTSRKTASICLNTKHSGTENANCVMDYCIWDSFRSLHPLLTIIDPESQTRMIRSLIDIYRFEGKLPDCRMSLCKGFTQGGSNADIGKQTFSSPKPTGRPQGTHVTRNQSFELEIKHHISKLGAAIIPNNPPPTGIFQAS